MLNAKMILLGLLGLLLIIICYDKDDIYRKKYLETFKKEIISPFLKSINTRLRYTPLDVDKEQIKKYYEYAEFDDATFDNFSADDYIEGFLNDNIFIKLCDLNITKTTYSRQRIQTITIFNGLFVYTTNNKKDINTFIKISSNKPEFLKYNFNRAEMDNEEFEELFDVYAENRLVAMQILTSNIMEYLINFRNENGFDYEIVIRDNTIYMRFFTGSMFEPQTFENSMDKHLLLKYYNVSKFILEFTERINKILEETEL